MESNGPLHKKRLKYLRQTDSLIGLFYFVKVSIDYSIHCYPVWRLIKPFA